MANSSVMDVRREGLLKEEDVPGAKLSKEPHKCIMEELKRWLECRGIKRSGKKDELIRRVIEAQHMNLAIDPKVDGGKWYNLKVNNISDAHTLPISLGDLPETGWKHFPSKNLPENFNYGHVYFYLVESSTKSLNIEDSSDSDDDNIYDNCDTVTAKPLKKGRSLLTSGFVENIQDNFCAEKHEHYIRAHVHHSMKNELPLNVNVVLSGISGHVKSGLCDCRSSSLERCSHVAALLLKLSDMADKGVLVRPSTSAPCQWNKGKKREKKPQKIHQADYGSKKRKHPSDLYNWDPRPENQRTISEDHITDFINGLDSTDRSPMWLTILSVTYEDFVLDNSESDSYKSLIDHFIAEFQENNYAILGTKISCEIPFTTEQANSQLWHTERQFRVTASICKKIVYLGESLGESLRPHFLWLEKNFWFPTTFSNFYTRYGNENEPKAVKEFEDLMKISVCCSGLWINRKYTQLAASPDGLIYDEDKNLKSIIEVKCLNILRLYNVDEIIYGECPIKEVKRQCFLVQDNMLVLKKNHSYYFQIQLQLLITEAEFCYFIMYSAKGPLSIEKIYPDADVQKRIVDGSRLFWEKVFVPEYFLMRVPRGLLPIVF